MGSPQYSGGAAPRPAKPANAIDLTHRHLIAAVRSVFLIQKPQLPFPKVDRPAGVEKLFLRSQLKFPQSLGLGSAAKAVELLSVDAKDVAETVPTQNGAEDLIEAGEIKVNGALPRPGSPWD